MEKQQKLKALAPHLAERGFAIVHVSISTAALGFGVVGHVPRQGHLRHIMILGFAHVICSDHQAIQSTTVERISHS